MKKIVMILILFLFLLSGCVNIYTGDAQKPQDDKQPQIPPSQPVQPIQPDQQDIIPPSQPEQPTQPGQQETIPPIKVPSIDDLYQKLAGSWTGDSSEKEEGLTCRVYKRGTTTMTFIVTGNTFKGSFISKGTGNVGKGPSLCGGDYVLDGFISGTFVRPGRIKGIFDVIRISADNIKIPFEAVYFENKLDGLYTQTVIVDGEPTSFEGTFSLEKK